MVQILVTALFAVAPFVMTISESEMTELISARTLPPFVSTVASVLRWALFVIMAGLSLLYLSSKPGFRISTPVYLLSLFYFIQFFYAAADGTDYFRFIALTIFSLLLPPIIGYAMGQNARIVKNFIYWIAFFLILSVGLNGHLVLSGQRFFGFLNNANAYGISTVFWLVILLLAKQYKLLNRKLFYIIGGAIFLTMLLSGSRNALVGVLLIFILQFYNKLGSVGGGIIMLTLLLIAASYFFDLSFVLGRYENLSGAVADSGREELWELAYFAMDHNFWWGNGMDANMVIVGTGNMHNVYIRFLLNMGIVFTVISLLMYLLSVVASVTAKQKVPLILAGYLLVYALMNVGEDYFVGLGSSAFIYMLFIYGFINYYLTRPEPVSLQTKVKST